MELITDNNIPGNVKNVINYYQTSESVGGESVSFDSDVTNGLNINVPGSNHRSIDNDLINIGRLKDNIETFIDFGGAVTIKDAKLRANQLPTSDPATTGSENIFKEGDLTGKTKETVNPKSTRK